VPFYGPQPAATTGDVAKTKAAVSAVYAELDTRITGTAPQMEDLLKKAGVPYLVTVYPQVNHAFHNDTGERYNAAQAQRAWTATIEWFRRHLA
jgi:carboxymethylenebutenolidase